MHLWRRIAAAGWCWLRRPACRPCRSLTLALPACLTAPEAPAAASRPEPSHGSAAESYAVVEIGGHQLVVEEGRWYTVNRLEVRGLCGDGCGAVRMG